MAERPGWCKRFGELISGGEREKNVWKCYNKIRSIFYARTVIFMSLVTAMAFFSQKCEWLLGLSSVLHLVYVCIPSYLYIYAAAPLCANVLSRGWAVSALVSLCPYLGPYLRLRDIDTGFLLSYEAYWCSLLADL